MLSMDKPLLNLDAAPDDAIERLIWLGGVMEQVKKELDAEFRKSYFDARLSQRLDPALDLKLHSHKRVMAFTRAQNQATGRSVRWGDGRA